MTMGIYDSAEKKSVVHQSVTVPQSRGSAYQVFDLGSHSLSDSMYLWVAPRSDPMKCSMCLLIEYLWCEPQ
ncbi:MAG: hypothetical protein R3C56_14915 [Pirellulaceae bacterium]